MIIEISSPNPPVVEVGRSTFPDIEVVLPTPKIEVVLPTPIGVNILPTPGSRVVEIGPSTSPKIEVTLPPPSKVNVLSIPGPPGADGTIVHVGPTPPLDPSVNDLWVDTT